MLACVLLLMLSLSIMYACMCLTTDVVIEYHVCLLLMLSLSIMYACMCLTTDVVIKYHVCLHVSYY